MARYSDTLRDQNGVPVIGALIAVANQDGSTAALTDDDGLALANPLASAAYGGYYFNAGDGFYDLRIYFGGRLVQEVLGVAIGTALTDTAQQVANAAAQEVLPAILASVAGSTTIKFWFVSPTATGTGNGTMASPWTPAQRAASSNTVLQPGDTVFWRGGAHPAPDVSPNGNGLVINRFGTIDKPIKDLPYPGEFPYIDARYRGLTWSVVSSAAGKNIYESNQTVAPSAAYAYGANIVIGGKEYPLVPARGVAGAMMNADSHTYSPNTAFYPGPMIELMASGKLRIRLDPPTSAAMLGRTVAQVSSVSPNDNEILVSISAGGVTFGGGNLVWGIPVIGAYHSFKCLAASIGNVSNIRFTGGYDRPLYTSFLRGGTNDCFVGDTLPGSGWISDGCLRPDWWVAYGDIKGGITQAEGARRVAMSSGDAPGTATASARWKHKRWIVRNFFDGVLGQGQNDEFGAWDDDDPFNHEKAWANACRFENVWDDSFQTVSSQQGLYVHHCFMFGAGFSRDGSTSTANQGTNWPRFEHLWIDPTAMLFYGRQGFTDADTGGNLAGMRYPPALSSHGIRTGGSDHTFPMTIDHCLLVVRNPTLGSNDLMLLATVAGVHDGGQNLFTNNILVEIGDLTPGDPLTGASVHPRLSTNYYADRGVDIVAGNLYVSLTGFQGTGPTTSIVRRIYLGGVAQTDPIGGTNNGWVTTTQVRSNASILAASKTAYAGGFGSGDVTLNVDPVTVINLLSGRALAGSAGASGAEDLTGIYPFLEPYTSFRGARASI